MGIVILGGGEGFVVGHRVGRILGSFVVKNLPRAISDKKCMEANNTDEGFVREN